MKKVWIGTCGPYGRFGWAPCPKPGMQRSMQRRQEVLDFEDSTADVVATAQYRSMYSLALAGTAKELDGVMFYNELAAGKWGTSRVFLANPMEFETNMMPPSWADPGLVERGWISPAPKDAVLSYSDSPAGALPFRLMPRRLTVTFAASPATTPTSDPYLPQATIPIPPGYTLSLGVTGVLTSGTGRLAVETWASGGAAPIATTNLTLLSETAATRMNATFAGVLNGVAYVRIFLTKADALASVLTLTSMDAQLTPTGVTAPGLTGPHVAGQGNLGLKFADDARVEEYPFIRRRGLSTTLLEVARHA